LAPGTVCVVRTKIGQRPTGIHNSIVPIKTGAIGTCSPLLQIALVLLEKSSFDYLNAVQVWASEQGQTRWELPNAALDILGLLIATIPITI